MYALKEILKYTVILVLTLNIVSFYKSQSLNTTYVDFEQNHITVDKSKPLVLHFWATWCPTCKIENQTMNKLSKDYQVITVAVNSNDLESFMKKHDLTFQTLNDKNGYYSNLYNIQVFPTTLIFDKNGKIVFSEVGYTSYFGFKLRLFWASLV